MQSGTGASRKDALLRFEALFRNIRRLLRCVRGRACPRHGSFNVRLLPSGVRRAFPRTAGRGQRQNGGWNSSLVRVCFGEKIAVFEHHFTRNFTRKIKKLVNTMKNSRIQWVQVPSTAPNRKSRSHKGFWIFSFILWFFTCKILLVSCIPFPQECSHFQNHFTR